MTFSTILIKKDFLSNLKELGFFSDRRRRRRWGKPGSSSLLCRRPEREKKNSVYRSSFLFVYTITDVSKVQPKKSKYSLFFRLSKDLKNET